MVWGEISINNFTTTVTTATATTTDTSTTATTTHSQGQKHWKRICLFKIFLDILKVSKDRTQVVYRAFLPSVCTYNRSMIFENIVFVQKV